MGKKLWIGLAAGIILLGAFQARAATKTVCSSGCEYTTIRTAIDAAASGDTINVAAGTYTERVTLNKANITLKSVSGKASTFIDGGGAAGAVVNITASGVTFDGFTVQNSTSALATGTLTSTGAIPVDGKTVKIGTKTYTFKTTLTPTEGQVLIGGSAATALDNLKSAINHTGTPDVDYKCAAVHPTVTATTNTDTTQTVVAKTAGAVGNLATTTTVTGFSWGSTTLTGGSEAYGIILEGVSGSTVKNSVVTNIYGDSYVFGIYMNNSNTNTLSNITINNLNQTTWVDFNGAWGVWLALSDSNAFTDITVSDLHSASDVGGVMLRSGDDSNSFTRTTVSGLTSTAASVWGSPVGISIWSGTFACNDNTFADTNISGLIDETVSTVDGWAAGIQVRGNSLANTGNTFTNTSISNVSSAGYTYGVAVTTGSSVTFNGGSISNITANPATPGSARGFNIWQQSSETTSAATISNMTISVGTGAGAGYGVAIRAGVNASLTSVHNSNITGNTTYGIINTGTGIINATNNWWGSADLATITSKISGSVTFGPYYVDAEKTALSNSIKAITDFHVEDQEGATAINEKKHTIKLVLFNDNDEDNSSIKTLKTTFTTTGASVKVGTTLQVSGTTANDFTDHVTYTVTAEDASTQDYTVTITEVAKDPITPDEDGKAETTKERPQVVITDTTKPVTITVSDATENPTINVSTLIVDGTGTLPQITVNTSTANIAIAESTIVTSVTSDPGGPVWDGVIAAPTITVVTLPETTGETKTPGTAIEIGFTGGTLFFTKAVRISFPGEAGKRAGHTRPGEPFSEITTICGANTQDWADTLAADGDCKIDVGSDLVIWTMHFTKYALYTETATPAATGDSGGGGCFIATAVFGSYQERHVWVLRQFRDQFLLTNTAGKAFVSFYYQHSPVLANWIAEREWVKAVTRILLLPLYGIAYLLINGLGWVLLAGLLLAVAIFIATQHLKSAGKTNLESRATLAGMVIGLFNALATRRYLGIAGFRKQV